MVAPEKWDQVSTSQRYSSLWMEIPTTFRQATSSISSNARRHRMSWMISSAGRRPRIISRQLLLFSPSLKIHWINSATPILGPLVTTFGSSVLNVSHESEKMRKWLDYRRKADSCNSCSIFSAILNPFTGVNHYTDPHNQRFFSYLSGGMLICGGVIRWALFTRFARFSMCPIFLSPFWSLRLCPC